MYSLFSNTGYTVGQGILTDPNWLYLKPLLHRNLTNVVKFHRKNPMAVNSDHFLVKMLQSLNIPQSQNLERYYNNVDAVALGLSMTLQMTSSIFKGRVFNGIFYGDGNTEILIAHNESFNPFIAHADWQNLCPVTVLRHPRSDLGLNIPDGTNTGSETGVAIIAINIPMLAVQYRAFRLNEINLNQDAGGEQIESQRSVYQFIYMYVLPNMLFSHLDYTIFNRIYNLETGAPLGESSKNHSFYVTDYGDRMTYIHNNILNHLHNVDKTFIGALQTVPMVIKDNAYESMRLLDIAETRQVIPALFLSRLNVLSFLFRIARNGAGEKNRSLVNQIQRTLKVYGYDNLFRNFLPFDLYKETMNEINDLK